jgi:hypothetical protein
MIWNAKWIKQIRRIKRVNAQKEPRYPLRRAKEEESRGKVISIMRISLVNRDLDPVMSGGRHQEQVEK